MYISRVRLENIRGFSDRRNVDLTLTRPDGSHAGWTVLAGRNGSGKTSLLRAIGLTVDGPVIARSLIPDFRSWTTAGMRGGGTELRLKAAPEDYQPENCQRATDLVLAMHWDVDAVRETFRPGSRPVMSNTISTNPPTCAPTSPASKSPWQADPIGWFCTAYGPFRRLEGGSAEGRRLVSTPGPIARLASLFYEGVSLTGGVQWLIDNHLRALEGNMWADDLKKAAIQILADGLLPDNHEVADVDSSGLWVTSGGHRFPLREMSDGYRSTAALVADLIKRLHDCYGDLHLEARDGAPVITAPGVVIIDEVDAQLHVSWRRRIGAWLKKHFPNIQFIVSTHSPYICQAADQGGLICLPGPGEDEPPQVVTQDLHGCVVYKSGDGAVQSELFGLEAAYPERAEELPEASAALPSKADRLAHR